MQHLFALMLVLFVASGARAVDPQMSFINGVGMRMKLVPAGSFIMGSSRTATETAKAAPMWRGAPAMAKWFEDEHPRHKVRITAPFYLGVTEVTQEQYLRVMGKNPSLFSDDLVGGDIPGIHRHLPILDANQHPVENVSWHDAVEFCSRLSAKEKRTYRLPTEAEWEYACRAGSETVYSFGNDPTKLNEYAWICGVLGSTYPVAQKPPNTWGFYDMHGNVWEWCNDLYAKDYYSKSPTRNPTGPSEGLCRVYRGGNWGNHAVSCRSASRGAYAPSLRLHCLGFRVVAEFKRAETNAMQDTRSTPARTEKKERRAGDGREGER